MSFHIWNAVHITAFSIGVSLMLLAYCRDNKRSSAPTPSVANSTPTPPLTLPTQPGSYTRRKRKVLRPNLPYSKPSPELAAKLFNIVELAESIFLNLDTESLFDAQNVCRQWKSVIESSPSCRKALFLEPGSPNDVNLHNDYFDLRYWNANNLRRSGLTSLSQIPGGAVFNPLLVDNLDGDIPAFDDTTIEGGNFHAKLLKACNNKEASCRRMFITQPPLEFLNIAVDLDGPRANPGWRLYLVVIDQGVYKVLMETSYGRLSMAKSLGGGLTLADMADGIGGSLAQVGDTFEGSQVGEWQFFWKGAERNEMLEAVRWSLRGR